MEADILSANRGQCEDYSPIVTSHTFQLKMMNPKNCMSVALRDFKKDRGLIAPPPQYLEVSLQAGRDIVNIKFQHRTSIIYWKLKADIDLPEQDRLV